MAESKSIGQLQKDAEQFFKDKKYYKCIEVCTEIISRDDATETDKASAYYNSGKAKAKQGKMDEAIADYDKAIELDPKDASVYYNRGVANSKQGKYEEAIADYDKAIELDPKDASVYYNRGYAKDELKKYEEVIADYDKAIELDPNKVEAYINRGNTNYRQGKYEEAIADYDKAIELDPKDASVYYNRGYAKDELKKYEEAIADYDKAIELDPNKVEAYINRGNTNYRQGKYEEAIADYDKAIELDPNKVEAYYNRGVANSEQGKYDEAIKGYDKAIELDPNKVEAYFYRGITKAKQEKYEEALADYDKAIELNPQDPKAYYYKGLLLLIHKKYDSSKILEGIYCLNIALQNGISGIDMNDIADSDSNDNKNNILSVFKNVLEILDKLKVTKNDKNYKEYLSHTTRLSVLKQLLPIPSPSSQSEKASSKNIVSAFRLYHIVYSNDPTEGDILFKTLGIEDEKESLPYVMIASFSSGDSSEKLDVLPLWSTYGDNTKGVSLLFKTEGIASDERKHIGVSGVKKVLEKDINITKDTDDSSYLKPILYRVYYTDISKNEDGVTKNNEEEIAIYLKNIKDSLKEIKPKEKNEQQEEIYKKILELLFGLRYLIKDKSYEYENEYRLVCFPPFDSIQYDEKDTENDAINRMYVEEDIITKLDSLIVGAKVPPAKVLEIKYLLKKCDKTKNREIKVIPSSIPYR